MSRDTYEDWEDFHVRVFGITSEPMREMVSDISGIFMREGFTPKELFAASDFLAINCPPKFPGDHLSGLSEFLRNARRKAHVATPSAHVESHCTLCAGGGVTAVPMLAGMVTAGGFQIPNDGAWRTVAVLCHCHVGRRLALNSRQNEKVMRTLEDYAREVPDWRQRMKEHDEAGKLRTKVTNRATALDKAMGPIMGKLQVAGR